MTKSSRSVRKPASPTAKKTKALEDFAPSAPAVGPAIDREQGDSPPAPDTAPPGGQ